METTKIIEALENLGESELVQLWNDYQSEISGESQIYDFDDELICTVYLKPTGL